jgi:hypothetical protein
MNYKGTYDRVQNDVDNDAYEIIELNESEPNDANSHKYLHNCLIDTKPAKNFELK